MLAGHPGTPGITLGTGTIKMDKVGGLQLIETLKLLPRAAIRVH